MMWVIPDSNCKAGWAFVFFLIAIVVIVIIDWNYGVMIIGNIFIFIIKFIDIIYEFQNSKNLIL